MPYIGSLSAAAAILGFLCILLSTIAVGAQNQAAWYKQEGPDRIFTVEIPAKPTYSTEEQRTARGTAYTLHTYQLEYYGKAYVTSAMTIPPDVDLTNPRASLQLALDGGAKSAGVEKWDKVVWRQYRGAPAVDATGVSSQGVGLRQFTVLSGPHLYMLIYAGPISSTHDADVERFFDSLRIKPADVLGPPQSDTEKQPLLSTESILPIIVAVTALLVLTLLVVYRGRRNLRLAKANAASVEFGSSEAMRDPEQAVAVHAKARGPVFIAYRRDDSADVTGRIYDRLVHAFGSDRVFKDVDSIPPGVDFRKYLQDSVVQCNVLLAVIGPDWLATSTDGKRRLDNARDYLRIEIETALDSDVPILPVLVRNATMPSEEQLPATMQALAFRNSIAVRPDPDFHGDIDRLIRGVRRYMSGNGEKASGSIS